MLLQRPAKAGINNSDSDSSFIDTNKNQQQHLNAYNLQQLNHIEEQVDEGDEMGKTTHANKFQKNYEIEDNQI